MPENPDAKKSSGLRMRKDILNSCAACGMYRKMSLVTARRVQSRWQGACTRDR